MFDFKTAFDAGGNPIKVDRKRVREKAGKLPTIDWRETVEHEDDPPSPD